MTYKELYEKMQQCGLISGNWKHHLHFLECQPFGSGTPKEELMKLFLLYFALIDDGNVYMSLDAGELQKKISEKIEGIKVLREEEEDGEEKEESKAANALLDDVYEELEKAFSALSAMEKVPIVENKTLFQVKDKRLFTKRFFSAVEEILSSAKRLFGNHPFTGSGFDYKKYVKDDFKLTDGQEEILKKGFSNNLLVTGGPGTGKTTSVFFLLMSLLEKDPEKYTVYLAAPSGKAAARMKESIQREIGGLKTSAPATDKIASLQEYTIHRLLETDSSNNGFKHNRNNQFPENSIFVIDEASMIDVCLFSSLLEAIPDSARVFILGDKDQLPSVECGAVFAELLDLVHAENKVFLTESKRFKNTSEIYRLAEAVNTGGVLPVKEEDWQPTDRFRIVFAESEKAAETEEEEGTEKDPPTPIYYYKDDPCTGKDIDAIAQTWYEAYYKDLPEVCKGIAEDKSVFEEIQKITESARILCANNEGSRGVDRINRAILGKKFSGGRISGYYPGELVMVVKNDHALNLYNGDSGVAVTFAGDETLYLMFKKSTTLNLEEGKGGKKNRIFKIGGYLFYPAGLVNREDVVTAFAITIHKSQGSDYGNILVILPKRKGHPLLNRQIVYTAITRTKGSTYILSNQENLEKARDTVVKRDTGLK